MDTMTTTPLADQGASRRAQIKAFISSYREKNDGLSPSLQEIGDAVGLASHNAVRNHLLMMKASGEVTWVEGRYRTVRVVD